MLPIGISVCHIAGAIVSVNNKKFFTPADFRNILFLLCLYILLILFSRLYTIHPLDDDWSYIRAVQTFYQTGQMKFTPWTSPSLVFQVWWGALFAWALGFSANTLITSTLAISAIGSIFFYLLLRQAEWDAQRSLWIVLLFIFNPFSFPLLFTFFTDQHFLALMFIALFFYARGAAGGPFRHLLLGAVFAALAVLVRQQGILIAAGAGLHFLLRRTDYAKGLKAALACWAAPGIVFILYTYWFQNIHGATYSSLQQMQWIIEGILHPAHLFAKLFHRPILILEFLGLSFIPLSLALLPEPAKLFQRRQTSLILIFCLAGVLFYLTSDHAGMQSSIYTWLNGFHFAFVSEYGYRGTDHVVLFFYKIIDFLAIFSITYLLWLIITNNASQRFLKASSPQLMFLAIGVLQVLYLLVIRFKFTRYYLVLIPFFVLCFCGFLKKLPVKKKYFIPSLVGFIALCLMGTQDFLSWNDAKWKLGERLLNTGVPHNKISAGFPWDCWHSMDYCLAHTDEILPRAYDIPWWIEELLPCIDAEYLIANSPVPTGFYMLKYFCTEQYEVADAASYYSLLYGKWMQLYVLKRVPGSREQSGASDTVVYRFLHNLRGAAVRGQTTLPHDSFTAATVTIENKPMPAFIQAPDSEATFRLVLPNQRCALKVSVATMPDTWDKAGDGITVKILMGDQLLENLFDEIGMVGVELQSTFLKPRSYFFRTRTIYLRYLDPKHKPNQRTWHDVTLDLSRFAGKAVDLSLSVEPGPRGDRNFDAAVWGNPVIVTY